jgi:hypothetical protein
MFALSMIFPNRARSARMFISNCCGVFMNGVIPMPIRRSFTSAG